jgi:hypothetical protein
VIARLVREELSKLLGGAMVLPVEHEPGMPTDPRGLAKVYEGCIWALLREQERIRTRREPVRATPADDSDIGRLRDIHADLQTRAAHARAANAKMLKALGIPMTPAGEAMAASTPTPPRSPPADLLDELIADEDPASGQE